MPPLSIGTLVDDTKRVRGTATCRNRGAAKPELMEEQHKLTTTTTMRPTGRRRRRRLIWVVSIALGKRIILLDF